MQLETKARNIFGDRPTLKMVSTAILVFGIFLAVAWYRLDPDFGWHLMTGNYILAHGIPRHDIYTFTAIGHSWVDHEWGSDVILSLAYKLGGYLLAAILFSVVWTAALLALAWKSRWWVVLLAALALTPYAGINPIAWSILLFAICLRILNSKKQTWRYILPILFIPWANLHAGFIAGLALIAYFAVIEKNLKLALFFLLSIGATLINAYGINLYKEIAHTLFDPAIHQQILEWHVFYVPTPTMPFLFLWVVGFLFFARSRWRKWINLGPLLLLAGLSASRNFPFFIVATTSELSSYVTSMIKRFPRKLGVLPKVMSGVSGLLILVVLIYAVVVEFYPLQNRMDIYPMKAVAYLKEHPCSGHLFNDYNYGGVLNLETSRSAGLYRRPYGNLDKPYE